MSKSFTEGRLQSGPEDRMAFSRRRRNSRAERLSLLRDHIDDHLAMGWSPEQIAGKRRLEGSEHRVSHEVFYRYG